MPAPSLVQRHTLHSDLEPHELRARLAAAVEETDGEFPVIAKLSGAGIVVRVLDAPATTRPFFGRLTGLQFAISQSTRGRESTPFQPILRGTIERDASGAARVDVELRPHPRARTFELAGKLAGGALALVAIPATLAGAPEAVGALLFAALFWVFPKARARAAFKHDCARALVALEQAARADARDGDA